MTMRLIRRSIHRTPSEIHRLMEIIDPAAVFVTGKYRHA